MSILCIGQATYDITIPTQDSIVENQKYRIEISAIQCAGGPATNAAYLTALWGANTFLSTSIGKDAYGKNILDELSNVGVDVSLVAQKDELETPFSFILSNLQNGNRTIFNCPHKGLNGVLDLPKEAPSVILVDGHELKSSIKAIEHFTNSISILDAGTCRETTLTLAKMVDYLVCSEDFANQYTNDKIDIKDFENAKKIYAKLQELCPNNVVITLGDKGLLYLENGEVTHMKAYKAKAIDTTGAGDIFHGAFAYCIDQKYSLKDALELSSAASSVSVETMGGQFSIPTLEVAQKRRTEWQ